MSDMAASAAADRYVEPLDRPPASNRPPAPNVVPKRYVSDMRVLAQFLERAVRGKETA